MMAKMFYTLDETKSALGKSEEEIKQYAREGRLREFRDGARLMFKADQVDQLRGEVGGGGANPAGLSDSGAPISLADAGISGSGAISLADTDFGRSPGAGMVKEDSALAADLGLSGTMGGLPSPGRVQPGTGTGLSGTAAGRSGITVFDVDDNQRVDPSAQTAIGSGVHDQVNLEAIGSGSGLLDLTRESDDTSLGAELIDEIVTPANTNRPVVSDSGMEMDVLGGSRPAMRGGVITQPLYVEAHDSLAPAFGWMSLFAAMVSIFALFVVGNALFGYRLDVVNTLRDKMPMALIGSFVGALVFFLIGWMIGKTGGSARR